MNDKRVDPETGVRQRFSSAILPACARKSPKVAEVLPLLYLHGLSSLDFGPALEQFLGSGAGLSAATITYLHIAVSIRLCGTDGPTVNLGGTNHIEVRPRQDLVTNLPKLWTASIWSSRERRTIIDPLIRRFIIGSQIIDGAVIFVHHRRRIARMW